MTDTTDYTWDSSGRLLHKGKKTDFWVEQSGTGFYYRRKKATWGGNSGWDGAEQATKDMAIDHHRREMAVLEAVKNG